MRGPRGGSWFTAVVVLVPLVPILVALVARAVDPPVHVGDYAAMELDVRDLGAGWWSTGAWSRFGFRHPGPALTYLWAPVYHLGGASGLALQVSAGLVTAALLTSGLLVVVRGAGRTVGAAMAAATLALQFTMGPDMAIEAWNPNPVVPAAVAAICGLIATWAGDVRGVPLAAVASSIALQAHAGAAGFAVVVGALVLVAVVGRRGQWPAGRERWVLLGSVGAVALLWFPPLWDQVAGSGNLGRLLDGGFSERAGVAGAGGVALRAWSPTAWWVFDRVVVRGPGEVRGPLTLVPLLVVPVAVGAAVLRRRGRRDLCRAVVLAAAPAVVGVAAVVRMDAWLFGYLVGWLPVSVVTAVAISVAGLLRVVRPGPLSPRAVTAVTAALLLGSVATAASWVEVRTPYTDCMIAPATVRLADALERAGVGAAPVTVETAPDLVSVWAATGLVLEADRRGWAWRGGPSLEQLLRPIRLNEAPDGTDTRVLVAAVGNLDALEPDAGRVAVAIEAAEDGCGRADVEALSGTGGPHLVGTVVWGDEGRG